MNLTLNSVGSEDETVKLTIEDIETINLTTQGEGNFVEFDSEDLNTLNITGDSNVVLTAVPDSLENVDASELTGNLTVDLSTVTSLATLETGAGDDSITVSANNTDTEMVLAGGDGEDVLTQNNSR